MTEIRTDNMISIRIEKPYICNLLIVFLCYMLYVIYLSTGNNVYYLCVPLQHLPLQESVKVHAVLVVCEWSFTQVVMDGPGPTHNTAGSAKAVKTENMVQPKIL